MQEHGVEQLVVVQEIERTWVRKIDRQDILKTIRRVIAEQFELQLAGLLLLKPTHLPKTTSGKVQRLQTCSSYQQQTFKAIFEWSLQERTPPHPSEPEPSTSFEPSRSAIDVQTATYTLEQWFVDKVASLLHVSPSTINIEDPLANYGLSSLTAARLSGELQDHLQIPVDPVIVYDYPTIRTLAEALVALQLGHTPPQPQHESLPLQRRRKSDGEIAVVGIGCRFPGAQNAAEFWQVLRQGQDCISEVPSDRWPVDAYYNPTPGTPGKMNTRWGGFIEDVAGFDAAFFKISAREAQTMDPQQRLLLEVTWQALENAGLVPDQLRGSKTGVFIGICSNDYARLFQGDRRLSGPYAGTSNAYSIAANRLSYLMNWQGPSMAIDTACSSSLVAIHQASQNLKLSDCDLAIAGGVNLILNPDLTITFSEAGMMAPDGRCKPFDASANGYVRGEGCGIVVLKRLEDALKDGNRIYGVMKGSAINQDGQSNGLTAPNSKAQEQVIRAALNAANLSPQQISAIEAHGTGTALGDPIEMTALKAVYGQDRNREQPLAIGSVKSNIGHLEAAAGVAGFIKTVLSLYHRHQVPTLHFYQLNPLIELAGQPLQIVTEAQPLLPSDTQQIYGVSSFGFGGTNAHVIVGDWPQQAPVTAASDRPCNLLTLSGNTEQAVLDQVGQALTYLTDHPDLDWGLFCTQMNQYRSDLKVRLAIVAESAAQLQSQLAQQQRGESTASTDTGTVPSQSLPQIGFLFSGQGAQYPGMGQDLYQSHPGFRKHLNTCAAILEEWLDRPLLTLLDLKSDDARQALQETQYVQPVMFALEYALAQFWIELGIQPSVVMGHSLGEYVAACIAGVFSLEDGLKLVTHRGRLMQSLPANGTMLATLGDEQTIKDTLEPFREQLNIAAINGPNNLVISGVVSAMEECIQALEAKGVSTRHLSVSHGFHSPLMDPILEAFRAIAQQVTYHSPQLAIISNLTGEEIGTDICTPEYWVQHIRQPVQFAKSMSSLLATDHPCLLEVGPQPTLIAMTKRLVKTLKLETPWLGLPSLHPQQPDWQVILNTLAKLYTQGVSINWAALNQGHADYPLDSLPTYPFQHRTYWLSTTDHPTPSPEAIAQRTAAPPLTSNRDLTPVSSYLDRRSQILHRLTAQIQTILVDDGRSIEPQASFLELGADSINLMELIQSLEQNFGIKVSVKDLFTQFNSLETLAGYLDQVLPTDWTVPDLGSPSNPPALFPTVQDFKTEIPEDITTAYGEVFDQVEDLQVQLHRVEQTQSFETLASQQLAVLQTVILQQLELLKQTQNGHGQSAHTPYLQKGHGRHSNDNAGSAMNGNGHHSNGHHSNGHHSNGHPTTQPLAPSAESVAVLPVQPEPTTQPTDPIQVPLSAAQQQIWWTETLHRDQNLYLIPIAIEIKGEINIAALEASLNQVIERHESLRTRFCHQPGDSVPEIVQEVLPTRPIQIAVEDPLEDPSLALIQRYLDQLCRPKFQLDLDPLIRAQVLCWEQQESVLLLVLHHLVADAWSTGVLIRELLQLYPAQCDNNPLKLEPLPLQYPTFVQQQAIALLGNRTARVEHWRQILQGAPVLLQLPSDQPHPHPNSVRGKTFHQQFSRDLSQQLKATSRDCGVTLYMLLLAAYSVLLYQYSGQSTVIIGSTLANRQQPETRSLIGLCLQTLLLKLSLDLEQPVTALLEQVQQVTVEAFAEPDIPFEALQDLKDEQTDWVQTLFILQSTPRQDLTLPGLTLKQLPVHGPSAKCPLSLWMEDRAEGLYAEWEYNCDRFSAGLIQSMAAQFTALLESLFQAPQRSLKAQLQHLAREQGQWASLSQAFPPAQPPFIPVHRQFEQQVQSQPNAIALEQEEERWSYHDLNQRANQIAQVLIAQGIEVGDLVAMGLPRSPQQIMTLLGILKAGAAYLPLDLTYPVARIKLMLEDAQPKLLITQGCPPVLADLRGCPILNLNTLDLTETSTETPTRTVEPKQGIYVIYTSGSTGRPKGTMLTHQGVANFIQGAIARYGWNAGGSGPSVCLD